MLEQFFLYPNDRESFADVMFSTLVRLKLSGEAFWEVAKNGLGEPVDYYYLEGDIVIYADEFGNLLEPAYEQRISGGNAQFNADEVIHFKISNPAGGLRGESPLDPIARTIVTDIHAIMWNKKFFENSGAVSKVYQLPTGTSETEVVRNKAEIRSYHSGTHNAHEPLILEGDIKVNDLESSMKDMQFAELRKLNRAELSAVLGIPMPKLSSLDANARGEFEEADRAFYYEEILPLLEVITSKLNQFIMSQVGIYDYVIKVKPFEPKSLKETARIIDVLGKYGFITMNEARSLMQLSKVDGGDKFVRVNRDGSMFFTDKIDEGMIPINGQPAASEEEQSLQKNTGVQKSISDLDKRLGRDFDRIAEKIKRGLQETLSSPVVTLDDAEDSIDVILNGVEGDELAVTLTSATEKAYLVGGKGIARKLGTSFGFDRVPEEAARAMLKRALKLSESTISDLLHGESGTGRGNLRQVLIDAMREGKSVDAISKSVEEFFDEAKAWKAARIARTEPARAYNDGRYDVATSAGVKKARIMLGGNPCEYCVEMAAQFADGAPIDEVYEFFDSHHPHVDCTLVPVVE
jgi:HK97 family phage portal protein